MSSAHPLPLIEQFAQHHGFSGSAQHIATGYVNDVYAVGSDIIVRVTKEDMDPEDSYTEAVAVPAAIKAGIATPRLIALDDSCSILPRVATIYERMPGVALATLRVDQSELPDLYRQLGSQIGLLHTKVESVVDEKGWLDYAEYHRPLEWLEKALSAGTVEQVTGDWLTGWVERIEPQLNFDVEHRFLHNDLHAGNVMVHENPLRLEGIIDWGDAAGHDPIIDFETMPVWAVPWAFEGYREAGGTVDETFVGRLLWHDLGTALEWTMSNDRAGQNEPWAPLSTSLLFNLTRLCSMDQPEEWSSWLP